MEMPEHVYTFTHKGVRWSLGDDGCLASDQGHHFPLVGAAPLVTEVFRLAAENRRLMETGLTDQHVDHVAAARRSALAEAALTVARVVSPESIPFATAACARLVRGEEDRPPRYQVLAMLHAMEAGAEHFSGPERAKEG